MKNSDVKCKIPTGKNEKSESNKYQTTSFFRKDMDQTRNHVRLTANENQDKFEVERAEAEGTCCWKLCDRTGKCKDLRPLDPIDSSVGFVYNIKAIHCIQESFLNSILKFWSTILVKKFVAAEF